MVFTLALGTYGFVFLSQGPSYRQWKWITFYVPILCGTAVLVAAATITLLLARWGKSLADDVAAAGVIAYGLLALSNSTVTSFPLVKSVTPANSVPVELSTLASSPAFDDVDELNIDLGPLLGVDVGGVLPARSPPAPGAAHVLRRLLAHGDLDVAPPRCSGASWHGGGPVDQRHVPAGAMIQDRLEQQHAPDPWTLSLRQRRTLGVVRPGETGVTD